jgi:hypothetical protein
MTDYCNYGLWYGESHRHCARLLILKATK